MSGVYVQGQEVELTGTVVNGSGVATDPDEASLTLIAPDGTQSNPSVTTDSEPDGQWTASFTADSPGTWQWRLDTTDPLYVEQGAVYVSPSVVPEDEGS
jgi:hypothetical protein